jgi:type IV pilus assembly protein PilV
MRRPQPRLRLSHGARGVGLFDALIALAILGFGLLGMTRLQANLVRQSSESQARMTAVQLGDELLSTALVDTGNAACYTLPAEGVCGSAVAAERVEEWESRVKASLPGTVEATVELDDDLLTVTIRWTGKESGEERTLEVTTDVRE